MPHRPMSPSNDRCPAPLSAAVDPEPTSAALTWAPISSHSPCRAAAGCFRPTVVRQEVKLGAPEAGHGSGPCFQSLEEAAQCEGSGTAKLRAERH